MENKPENKAKPAERKPADRKPTGFGQGALWLFVIMSVAILVIVTYNASSSQVKIDFSDFKKLVENNDNPNPALRVVRSQDNSVEYSQLKDIKLEDFQVIGTVQRTKLKDSKPADLFAPSAGDSAKPKASPDTEIADTAKSPNSNATPAKSTTAADGTSVAKTDAPKVEAGGTVAAAAEGTKPEEPKTERVPFVTDIGRNEHSSAALEALMYQHEVHFNHSEAPSVWKSYIPMIVVTALFVLVIFLMMRRLGGAGSPMAFGRSRGKMYAQEDLGITFDDVAGIDEAVEELREVVEFLKTPEKFQVLGGRIPKGILLVGPPGTGKTLLAKAIAGEAGVPFFSLSGSDFVEMFVGVGAARVRDMFQQAEAKAPCIIFIDELDALGKTRGSSVVGGHDEREQTLNALLVEMDGFEGNSGVIVLAASNRPETLDPALLRPGRFDRHVLVDRPDVRGREAILKVHVQNVKLDSNVSLKEVAGLTSGFVGADLANLVNEAALLAARKSRTTVGMQEFNDGVERVTAGLEKKQRVIHLDEKQRVAYHESGHALVAYCLPNTDPVHKVSIIPRGLAALGYTMQRPEGDRYLMTKSELESRIQVLLAGTITEEIVFEDISTGAQNDLERASELARSMVMEFGMSRLGRVNFRESNRSPFLAGGGAELGSPRSFSEQTSREIDEEVRRIIDDGIEKVRDILESRRASLELLAQRLLEREVIDATELKEIMEETSTSPAIVPGTTADRKPKVVIEPPEPRIADASEGTV
ncbi:MAG: ATP-dependent zinc metalloprotease FtsH [Planctomycetota bacterium]|nr:ATP-dependent zinc metalloprotease FtsH [Planctomycetota bacterium]